MNKDIRVELGFFDHRKTRKLIDRFGLESAWGLLRLWAFAARSRPTGVLSEMSDEDIAMEMHIDGKVNVSDLMQFISGSDCKWLDKKGEWFSLHDWHVHNPWAAGSDDRSDRGRFVRLAHLNRKVYDELRSSGVNAVSQDEYRKLTACQRPVNATLTPTPSPAPSPAPNTLSKTKNPTKPVNPSVHVLQEYLKSAFNKKFGSDPVMSYAAIGKQLKVLLEKEKFTEGALKEMIDWFMTSSKAQEHPTPAAAISTDTVQRWQVACPEVE